MTNNREKVLSKRIDDITTSLDLDTKRFKTWVSFIAMCGALESAVKAKVIDAYGIKGGFSIELRLGLAARASGDIDIFVIADTPDRVEAFQAALNAGFDKFSFRIRRTHYMENVDTYRLDVVIEYDKRPHQTAKVDLVASSSKTEGVVANVPGILELGFANPEIPCVSIEELVAEKIHGATNPKKLEDRSADRGRDLIDVLLLELLIGFDALLTLSIAKKVFNDCNTHAWPPSPIEYPPQWRQTMETIAKDLNYPLTSADAIISAFNKTVQRVASAEESVVDAATIDSEAEGSKTI